MNRIPALRRIAARRHARGAMMVMALFALGVALAGFTALGLGQSAWQKRELQKIADVAARIAASQLADGPAFEQARQAAINNGLLSTDTLQFECLAGLQNTVTACNTRPEAVRARVNRTVRPFFFGTSTPLQAIAAAEPSPVVSARLTTNVASLDTNQSALLNAILSSLGGGAVNLNAVGGGGLINTNASVDLLRLSTALGVTTLQELLNLRLGLGDLLNTGNIAAGVPQLDLSLKSILNRVQLPVGQLLNLDLTQADAALAVVNLGDLALTGILGSVQGRAIDLKLANIPAGLNIKLYVVEPPRILIARQKRGQTTVGRVRGAQVKIEANFEQNISNLLGGLNVGGLLQVGLLKGGIYVQVGGAEVVVNELRCKMPRNLSETRFTAENGLLKLCLSDKPSNFADTADTEITCGAPADVLSVKVVPLLGLPLNTSVSASAVLKGNSNTVPGVLYGKTPQDTFPIPNSTGQTLSNLLKPPVLQVKLEAPLNLGFLLNGIVDSLVSGLLPIVTQALTPILNAVGNLVDSLLQLPGISLNQAQFEVERLDCSGTRLIQ